MRPHRGSLYIRRPCRADCRVYRATGSSVNIMTHSNFRMAPVFS